MARTETVGNRSSGLVLFAGSLGFQLVLISLAAHTCRKLECTERSIIVVLESGWVPDLGLT